MKTIVRNIVPPLLLAHKKTAHANYENLSSDAKGQLRDSLLDEQGHLCCYCMRRIRKGEMKIEHWHCQSNYPKERLEYKNLLGACDGNSGKPKHMRTCDTKKGDTDITINPSNADHNCELKVKFSTSGEAYSDDASIDAELNEVLNLNMQTLKNNRKTFLQEAIEDLASRHPKGTWTQETLNAEIERWNTKRQGKLQEYCQVIIGYLRNKH